MSESRLDLLTSQMIDTSGADAERIARVLDVFARAILVVAPPGKSLVARSGAPTQPFAVRSFIRSYGRG